MEDVNRKIAFGAFWTILFKFSERGLGLVSTIVLARLLVPEDFGIVAWAMAVLAVIDLLRAFNFGSALIQKQDAERSHYDTAWTFNVLFSVVSSGVLAVLAVPIARAFEEPRLAPVLWVLAFASLIEGFNNIGVIAFQKDMQFGRDYVFRIGRKITAVAVTLIVAIVVRNHWALIAGIVAGRMTNLIVSFVMHPFRPRLSLAVWRDLFGFSKWMFSNSVLTVARQKSSDFVIAKFVGLSGLGLYTLAYEISNLPTTELVAPINRAVFPGYAKMSHDPEMLRRGYLNVIAMIALFAIPAGVGISAVAAWMVPVVLGAKWLATIPLIQILALYGVLSAMQSNIASAYMAIGRPRMLSILGVLFLVVFLPMLGILTPLHGPLGAAWACLASGMIVLPVNYALMFRALDLRVGRFVAEIWRPVVGAGVMFGVVNRYVAWVTPETAWMQAMHLALASAVGALVYAGVVLGLWWLAGRPAGCERLVIDLAVRQVRARRSATAGADA